MTDGPDDTDPEAPPLDPEPQPAPRPFTGAPGPDAPARGPGPAAFADPDWRRREGYRVAFRPAEAAILRALADSWGCGVGTALWGIVLDWLGGVLREAPRRPDCETTRALVAAAAAWREAGGVVVPDTPDGRVRLAPGLDVLRELVERVSAVERDAARAAWTRALPKGSRANAPAARRGRAEERERSGK